MQSWNIDPKTGDYVMSGGAPVETDSLQVPAYFRLKIKRKTWMYAPDDKFGSDFYLVKKRPATNAGQKLENIAIAALQPIADDGRAKRITVQTDELSRQGAALTASIIDASGEEQVATFTGLGV